MHPKPAARMGPHRNTGELHALNISGEWHLNDGRVIRAGEYVREFVGNIDWGRQLEKNR